MSRPIAVIVLLAVTAQHAHGDEDARPDDDDDDDDDDGEAETLIAVVRVAGEDDAAILARIEGQTSDLDVELRIDKPERDRRDSDSDIAEQLSTARALARRYRARVVVWFRRDGDACIVYVSEPDADRLLVRRIATGGGQMAGSAAAEAAALVVRTALRALAAGGEIGVEAPAPPPPPPAMLRVEAPPPPRETLSSVRPLRPFGVLSWRGVVDGASDLGHHGVTAELGAAGGPWRVAAAGGYYPAVAHRRAEATIEVERMDIGVVLGFDLIGRAETHDGPAWRVGADLGLGVARYRRTTTVAANPLMATPATTTWGATVTPGLRVARRLFAGTWIELGIGIDLIGNAPEFGVANQDAFTVHTRLWPAEPHAGIGVVVDTF